MPKHMTADRIEWLEQEWQRFMDSTDIEYTLEFGDDDKYWAAAFWLEVFHALSNRFERA